MRISERGQVTIPRALREQYGFQPDTEVEFVPDKNGLRLVPSPAARAAKVKEMYGRKKFDRSTDELMSLLRK